LHIESDGADDLREGQLIMARAQGRRVMIVDDHELYREGLRSIVEAHPSYQVVAQAATVREAYALLDSPLELDLLIVDLSMPGSNGMALLRELRRRRRREPVLVLTMHADANLAAEAFAAGAKGFALKSDSRAELLEAIEHVASRQRYVAPTLPLETIEAFLRSRPGPLDAPGPLAVLTVREREIFGLLAGGHSNNEIATELCVSFKTVDTHRTHIFKKLGLHSMFELLRFAFRHHLVEIGLAGDEAPPLPESPEDES
jgi:DNA-binding NarL/FixJ family response regulator